MKPEQQQEAILRACGYTQHPTCRELWKPKDKFYYRTPSHLPDFCNDLNAMHEAENVLDDSQADIYAFEIHAVAVQRRLMKGVRNGIWYAIHADASERAEAFLKTLNLWQS